MPKRLQARSAIDDAEEQYIRRLASARTATFLSVLRARIVVLSWEGLDTAGISVELRCHPKTVRERISRFNEEGVRSITERPKVGRKPRLTEADRQRIITLATVPADAFAGTSSAPNAIDGAKIPGVAQTPDGPHPSAWPVTATRWTLDNLVAAAHRHGIRIGRSHLRRILQDAGFRWERGGYWIVPRAVGEADSACR
ncbi:MAG: helix-turn-helix domain-containing protein [Chloroflexota bacterium]